MADIAKRVVLKMETRKFRAPYDWPVHHSSSQMSGLCSLDQDVESCAICLEAYRDGQVSDHDQGLNGQRWGVEQRYWIGCKFDDKCLKI